MKESSSNSRGPGHFSSTTVGITPLSSRYFLLSFSRPPGFQRPLPGNFLHLLVPRSGRFFLRRPFSVFGCDEEKVTLLIAQRGEGTTLLRRLQVGSKVDFIGPLGNTFPVPGGRRVLSVSGGVGLAPLYYYGSYYRAFHSAEDAGYRLVYGARTKEELFLDKMDLQEAGVDMATDDGSYGFAGQATELAEEVLRGYGADTIFSCGPVGMLKELARIAQESGIRHYVSLESRMACGLGACRSCVVPALSQGSVAYRTVCHDGPVFDAEVVLWSGLPVP